MIKFSCKKCNYLISVNEKYSGKKGKCPKCGNIIIVPEKSTIVELSCGKCGHKIKVPDNYAGKKGKCPKCKTPVIIPTPEKTQTESFGSASVTCSTCGETIKIPNGSTEGFIECPGCGSYIETSSGSIPATSTEYDTSSPTATKDDPYEYDSEEYEASESMDRRLIFIISGVAAVVVVGIIILAVVLRSSVSSTINEPEFPVNQQQVADTAENQNETEFIGAKAFTERYISLLENGEVDEAYKFHSPKLAKDVYRFSFEKLSKQIGSSRIIEMNCTRTQSEPHPEGHQISLWYDLNCEGGTQNVNVSVLPIGQDFKIDTITARDIRGNSFSIGLSDSDMPSQSDRITGRQRSGPSSGKFFFVIFTGFVIGTLFSASCLWVGMKITQVEGRFAALIGIAVISSLAGILPSLIGLFPCVGWLISLIVMFILICKWTDAEFWPDAVGIVLISGVVKIIAGMLLGFIISMA